MSKYVAISPEEAADRLAILELIEAYAHCADRRDAKGQMALFTADTHFVVYMNAKDPTPSQEQPVDVEQALAKEPSAIDLCEAVEVAEIGNHQAPLFAIHREVMRDAVGFAGGSIARQGEDGALSDEMHRGSILVQVGEDRSERLARVKGAASPVMNAPPLGQVRLVILGARERSADTLP
jgi:hypothetical protein